MIYLAFERMKPDRVAGKGSPCGSLGPKLAPGAKHNMHLEHNTPTAAKILVWLYGVIPAQVCGDETN